MNTDQDWRARSLCAGMDPDEVEAIFFPHVNSDAAEAKAICRVCPVAADCLTWALSKPEEHGVWGAMTERERAKVLGRPAAKPEPTSSPRCGTYSGVSRHNKAGEQKCDPCKRADADYEAARRAKARVEKEAAA